jgi:diguanylate cyclase (GGDEF)-like protein
MFRSSSKDEDRRESMKPSRFLWLILSVSLAAIGSFPIYTTMVLSPSFTRVLVEGSKAESLRVARYFATFLATRTQALSAEDLPPEFLRQLKAFTTDGNFTKIKIYSSSGVVVFSTESAEIGHTNTEDYFQRVMELGDGTAEVVLKGDRSRERKVVPADVIETYVPVTRDGHLLGALEVYYSISEERRSLDRVIYQSYGTLLAMALGLFAIIIVVSLRGQKSIRERDRAEAALRVQSLTDELTGLYNRRGFFALSQPRMKAASRDQKPAMVVVTDLDGLKEINDTFGHMAGDSAIIAMASILKENFRKSDLIARVGGDEFVALLTGGEAEFDEAKVAWRLQKASERHNKLGSRSYAVSMSAGFAHYDAGRNHSLEELVRQADEMMYVEKKQKKRPASV